MEQKPKIRNTPPAEEDQLDASMDRIMKVVRDVIEHEVNKSKNYKDQYEKQLAVKNKEIEGYIDTISKLRAEAGEKE